MSYAENLQTVTEFNVSWFDVPEGRISAEILTVFRESHNIRDDFYWKIKNGCALDPQNNWEKVDFKRITPLQKIEGAGFDSLIAWADQNEEGSVVIMSPSLEWTPQFKGYPQNKACFYQIAYTSEFPPQKILLGTTVTFDAPKAQCIDIAKTLNPIAENIIDPELLRNKILICPTDFDLLSLMSTLSVNINPDLQTPSQKELDYFVGEIKSGRDPGSIALEMQERGIIGNNSLHCERDNSILTSRSLVLNFSRKENGGWHIGNCAIPTPYCGRVNVEVGPCNVCRDCQKKFDEDPNYASAA